jgi:hypothetical protein
MPKRKQSSRRMSPVKKQPSVKKLLADVLSKPWAQPKVVVRRLVDSDMDNTPPCQSSKDIANTSSSALKRVEEAKVKKENGTTSPEPTLLNVPSSTQVELSQSSAGQVRKLLIAYGLA